MQIESFVTGVVTLSELNTTVGRPFPWTQFIKPTFFDQSGAFESRKALLTSNIEICLPALPHCCAHSFSTTTIRPGCLSNIRPMKSVFKLSRKNSHQMRYFLIEDTCDAVYYFGI